MPDSDKNKHNSYFPIQTSMDKYKDWLILTSILVLGIAGLCFIINNPIQKSKNDADKGKLISHLFGKNKANVAQGSIKSNLLKINGELKANNKLHFELQNKTDEAQYILLLGDKQVKEFKGNQISHQFKQAGIYKIELQQKLGDQISVVHSEYLDVI